MPNKFGKVEKNKTYLVDIQTAIELQQIIYELVKSLDTLDITKNQNRKTISHKLQEIIQKYHIENPDKIYLNKIIKQAKQKNKLRKKFTYIYHYKLSLLTSI